MTFDKRKRHFARAGDKFHFNGFARSANTNACHVFVSTFAKPQRFNMVCSHAFVECRIFANTRCLLRDMHTVQKYTIERSRGVVLQRRCAVGSLA